MQNEVDTMARNVRNENIALIARLKVSSYKKSQKITKKIRPKDAKSTKI